MRSWWCHHNLPSVMSDCENTVRSLWSHYVRSLAHTCEFMMISLWPHNCEIKLWRSDEVNVRSYMLDLKGVRSLWYHYDLTSVRSSVTSHRYEVMMMSSQSHICDVRLWEQGEVTVRSLCEISGSHLWVHDDITVTSQLWDQTVKKWWSNCEVIHVRSQRCEITMISLWPHKCEIKLWRSDEVTVRSYMLDLTGVRSLWYYYDLTTVRSNCGEMRGPCDILAKLQMNGW